MICVLCDYIGKGKLNVKEIITDIFFSGVLAAICFSLDSTFFLILGIVGSISVFLNLLRFFQNGNICPDCNNESLIPLNSPRAQNLIKDHKLTIPEEALKSSHPKTSQ